MPNIKIAGQEFANMTNVVRRYITLQYSVNFF